ncbi:OB-fold-containig protein [Novosphingobium malaysiense]|uniref:OB-fold-containig protein n=1 Tax=Novosphingobium malaysiense TaxID=1348853 RepID=UPI0018CCC62B
MSLPWRARDEYPQSIEAIGSESSARARVNDRVAWMQHVMFEPDNADQSFVQSEHVSFLSYSA